MIVTSQSPKTDPTLPIDPSALLKLQTLAPPSWSLPIFDSPALLQLKQLGMPTLALSPAILEAAKTVARIQENFAKVLEPLQGAFARVAEEQRRAELARNAGWLPHYTTPFDLVSSEDGPEANSSNIGEYYQENWDAVESQIRKVTETYDFDDELRATMGEALRAHRQGLYRAVVRLLFPEIERIATNEFYGGISPPASLKELRETVSKLPLGDVMSYDYGLELYKLVEDHLYERVGNNPDVRVRFVEDPVPNRHAALHGVVVYSTAKHSLNTIIMADFLFHVMNRMKRYAEMKAGT